MKYIFFSAEEYSFPIVKHLVANGRDVIMACIEDMNTPDLAIPHEETPEEKKQRMVNYTGLIEKRDHRAVLKQMKRMSREEKADTFVFFDYSDCYPLAEKVLDMGFTNGLFPTEFYYNMEKDRDWAKEFVKEHYEGIKVAEDHEFQSSEEGIEFLEDTEDIWVLKSNGSFGRTVVPKTDDPKLAKILISDALEHYSEDYEKEGYLLEKKIVNAQEVTPIKVYYNGVPIYTLAEFENKEFGAGNIGIQKGGAQSLSVRTPMNCELNRLAFPPIIDELAKKQPGLAIFDAGLMYDGKDFWFTEFCAMRFGYDGIFSEIVMRSEGENFVGEYFEDIVKGKSPLLNRFGMAVRLFNLEGSQVETKVPKDDLPIAWAPSVERHLFLYRAKKKGDQTVSVGGYDLLGCVTGHGDTLERAVNTLYNRIDKISFEKLYFRPKFDFMSTDYKSAILNRYEAIKPFMSLREAKPEVKPEVQKKIDMIMFSSISETDKMRFINQVMGAS